MMITPPSIKQKSSILKGKVTKNVITKTDYYGVNKYLWYFYLITKLSALINPSHVCFNYSKIMRLSRVLRKVKGSTQF